VNSNLLLQSPGSTAGAQIIQNGTGSYDSRQMWRISIAQ